MPPSVTQAQVKSLQAEQAQQADKFRQAAAVKAAKLEADMEYLKQAQAEQHALAEEHLKVLPSRLARLVATGPSTYQPSGFWPACIAALQHAS